MFLMIIRITKDRGISTDTYSNTYGDIRKNREKNGRIQYIIIEVDEKKRKIKN